MRYLLITNVFIYEEIKYTKGLSLLGLRDKD
jgi:hypothetical protein